jgi:hypothetical protein
MFENETKKSEARCFRLFFMIALVKNNVVQGIYKAHNYRMEYRFWVKPYACVIQRPFYTPPKISLGACYTEFKHNVAFLTLIETLHEISPSFSCSLDLLFRCIVRPRRRNESWVFPSG